MRSFRCSAHTKCTVENCNRLTDHLIILHIILSKPYTALHLACTIIPHITSSHDICFSIIIKKERCINSRNICQPMWLGPRTSWIFCCDNIISFICKICIDNIKYPIIIAKCRCHHTAYTSVSLHMKPIF